MQVGHHGVNIPVARSLAEDQPAEENVSVLVVSLVPMVVRAHGTKSLTAMNR